MLKLDLLDRKILCELDLDARQSASHIGKKLRASKETVNFRINRLLKRGIIKGFYPMLDITLLGKFFFKILIKFKELKPSRKEEILDFFAKSENMAQVLLLEGKFDVQLFFLAQDNSDLMKFMEKMNSFCGKEIKDKEIMVVDALHRFNLKLYDSLKENVLHKISGGRSTLKLDDLSLRVLREITKDARVPVLEIAKKLEISPQLVQYHLKKLKNVILSTHIAINYTVLNMQHYHLTFQVNDHKVIPKIIEFFKRSKKSLFATQMIGSYDCSSELIVKDNEELRNFIDDLSELFADKINIIEVLLIYKEYQMRLFPV